MHKFYCLLILFTLMIFNAVQPLFSMYIEISGLKRNIFPFRLQCLKLFTCNFMSEDWVACFYPQRKYRWNWFETEHKSEEENLLLNERWASEENEKNYESEWEEERTDNNEHVWCFTLCLLGECFHSSFWVFCLLSPLCSFQSHKKTLLLRINNRKRFCRIRVDSR